MKYASLSLCLLLAVTLQAAGQALPQSTVSFQTPVAKKVANLLPCDCGCLTTGNCTCTTCPAGFVKKVAPPVKQHTGTILPFGEAYRRAAKEGQYLEIYVGENNHPDASRGSYVQRTWIKELDGYKAGDVILSCGEGGKLLFVAYTKHGFSPTPTLVQLQMRPGLAPLQPTQYAQPSFQEGFGGFSSGGCANGQCGGGSAPQGFGFRRR